MNAEYPTPVSVPDPASETTSSKLERLSAAFVNIVNYHDFEFQRKDTQELVAHVHPDWRATMDTQPDKITFAEQLDLWRGRAEAMPDVRFVINHIASDVDERKGSAIVYINMEVTGMGDLTLHAMNEVRWRRGSAKSGGEWKCVYTLGMRGTPMNSGGLG